MSEKITEKMEFATQIHTAWDGAEQRMALRNMPRRSMSYDYLGTENEHSQYLRMMALGEQTRLINLPLWHAASPLRKTVYKSQAKVYIDPAFLWTYRNIGALMLWTSDILGGVKYDIKYITADGTIGIGSVTDAVWEEIVTIVVPVARCVLEQEGQYANVHSEITAMTLNLELLQNQNAPELPESFDEFHDEKIPQGTNLEAGLPEIYMGAEVFRYYPSLEADHRISVTRNVNRLDNQTGIFQYDLKSNLASETRNLSYLGFSGAEVHNLQRFFYRTKGMLKSFWLPSWQSDLELAETAQAGSICFLVKFNMYLRYYANNRRRRLAMVFYADGTCDILKIAGYSATDDGEKGKVYLENGLKRAMTKKSVTMISYLLRVRFASDALITDYETTGQASVSMGFTEVDE